MRRRGKLAAIVAAAALLVAAAPALAVTAKSKRMSVSSAGAQGDAGSDDAALSADGRFVAFESFASNLVADDTNGQTDVFLRNPRTGQTRRLSVSSADEQAGNFSADPALSANGRKVAFHSFASNLVRGDTNGEADVFVRNRGTGKTRRVSVSSGRAQGNAGSFDPAISANGRVVAFRSFASNLAARDTNGSSDIFVHNLRTGKTRRVSVRSGGAQGNSGSADPAISADGRFVAFASFASNLVARDTNGEGDVFVRNRRTGKTRLVSVRSVGAQANDDSGDPALSADGRIVAFESEASNLVARDTNDALDVFARNRRTGKTLLVSVSSAGAQGNHSSEAPALSADRRLIAFSSRASNLVASDTNREGDVFVRNRRTGKTRRVSVSSARAQGNDVSVSPALSADGRFVAFESDASNLVASDTNDSRDVFRRGPLRRKRR